MNDLFFGDLLCNYVKTILEKTLPATQRGERPKE
jgi:hypothetical protein